MKPAKCIFLFIAVALLPAGFGYAQMGVNSDASAPDNSAMLDVKSTTRGVLVPRMTAAERSLISNPATGLLVFCTDNNQFYMNQGTPGTPNWVMLNTQWLTSGTNIYYSSGNVGIGVTDPGAKLEVNGQVKITGGTPGTGKVLTSDINGLGSWQSVPYTGTVTSVGLAMPAQFSVSGSPVTGSGTLMADWASQSANRVLASPNGSSGIPSFRPLVDDDIPNTISIDASGIVSGIIPIARGGTNSATALSNNRLMVSGSGKITEASALSNGQLFIGSSGAAPVAANLTSGPGITVGNGAGSITITNTGFLQGGNSFGALAELGTNDNFSLAFRTNNLERMRIDNAGSVGIGTSSPGYPLHVTSGNVKIGNSAGDARKLYFGDGTNVYVGEESADNRLGLAGSSLMINIAGFTGISGQVLTSNGTTCSWQNAAVSGSGSPDCLARWSTSTTLGSGLTRDNGTTVGIGTSPDPSYRLRVEGSGSNTAVRGQYSSTRYGLLGTSSEGVYGQYDLNKKGMLGSTSFGAYGQYDDNHYGYLGTSNYGAQGSNDASASGTGIYGLSSSTTDGGIGTCGVQSGNGSGTNILPDSSFIGVLGKVDYGYPHHYGVFGTRVDDNNGPSAGVIGTVSHYNAQKPWGALGFQDSQLTEYAGYFNGDVKITGALNDGTGLGTAGSVLMTNGSSDAYWSSAAGIMGGGTTNYIPKWSGTASLSNSGIYDNGAGIGIGTTSPTSAWLTVNGNSAGTAVYGQFSASIFGYLGSSTTGVYGQYNNTIYGSIGNSSCALYGYYNTTGNAALSITHNGWPGSYVSQWTENAYMTNSTQNDGNSYSNYGNNSGCIKGYVYNGAQYTFGVAGWNFNDDNRCSGVFGADQGASYWGALGYKNSGNTGYGGYFTSSTTGTGKMPFPGVYIGNGIGAWGDLFGADIHGKIYGAFMEGGNYACFANGPVFRNNLDIHLQKKENGDNIVLYTNVTSRATVQTCGFAVLDEGTCTVVFDASFAEAVSGNDPIVVTLTPMGNTNGVYLSEVSGTGFTATENNGGRNSVKISFIAVGIRAGHEDPLLPPEVVAGDYVEKLSNGLHNDRDTQTNGTGLYFENGQLVNGIHSSTFPDPGKPPLEKK